MSDLIIYLILLSQCKTDTPLSIIGLNILDSSTKYTTKLEEMCFNKKLPVGSCAMSSLSFFIL